MTKKCNAIKIVRVHDLHIIFLRDAVKYIQKRGNHLLVLKLTGI